MPNYPPPLGRRLIITCKYADGYERQRGEETLGGFVIACGDALVVLGLVEEALDAVAHPVEVLAEAAWVFAIGFGRNVCLGVSVRDDLA